ncbi:hypothetical protein JCM8547_003810 [Rhodosporidiobolus lusitaniae]
MIPSEPISGMLRPSSSRLQEIIASGDHWCCEGQGEFSSLLDNYKCFHFVDCKDIPGGAKVPNARFGHWRKKDQGCRMHS